MTSPGDRATPRREDVVEAVARLLDASAATLAIAETSATGGAVTAALAQAATASAWFRGGVVVLDAAAHGTRRAAAVAEQLGADVGVSVDVAGPAALRVDTQDPVGPSTATVMLADDGDPVIAVLIELTRRLRAIACGGAEDLVGRQEPNPSRGPN